MDIITRKHISDQMIQYSFVNQFMLYMGLDEIHKNDYDILSLTMGKNSNLEFKHIVCLILNNEIITSEELRKKCTDGFSWCKNIERDFEYKK